MEYAMMVSCGAVDSSVPVVTVVHDCQVLDLPDQLFEPHDLPVDYIVTPTRVIQCEGTNGQRPSGMIWSILTAERCGRIPVLGRLRYREWKAGKDVRLAGETDPPAELTDVVPMDEDEEGDSRGPRGGRRRLPRRQRQEERETDRSGDEGRATEATDGAKSGNDRRRTRYGRGRRRPRQFARRVAADHDRTSESEKDASAERDDSDVLNRPVRGGRRFRRGFGRRYDHTSEGEKDASAEQNDDDVLNRPVYGGRRFRRGVGRRYGGGGRRPAPRPAENGDVPSATEEDAKAPRGQRGDRVSESDGDASGGGRRRGGPGPRGRPRGGNGGNRRRFLDDYCEGSVYVGSLPRSVRVSEFKAEVRDRDVQPLRVVWRGQSGFAFLNFRTVEDAEHALSALEGLHISDRSLRLEMAKSSGPGGGGGGGRRRRRTSPSRSDGGGDEGAQSDEA